MDTSAAANQLKQVAKNFRAAEHLQEVLQVAILAEQNQSELDVACEKLKKQKATLEKDVKTLSADFEKSAHEAKASMQQLQREHKEQVDKFQTKEDEVKEAIENVKKSYKLQVQDLDAAFEQEKARREGILAELDKSVKDTQILLDDTREKFKELA